MSLLISIQQFQGGQLEAAHAKLATVGAVEVQMLDRLLEKAAILTPCSYPSVTVLLPSAAITPELLAIIHAALDSAASVHLTGAAAADPALPALLVAAGYQTPALVDGVLSASKPSTVALPLRSSTAALPLRTSRAAKASLWAFTATPSSSGTTIDESSLLTAEDLERPTLIKREDCDVKVTRKACKNCSCGLRELLLDEAEADDLVAAGFQALKGVEGVDNGKGPRKIKSDVVTSSCGSCYLGDAFRCGSCPYLGLPAFEPGQKIQISAEMDDI